MELYCELLDESNARLLCIERGLNGQFNLHPNKIMTALETLHPKFYPVPFTQKARGPGHFHIREREQTFSKEDLFALHKKSGEVLHKGNVKKLLTANTPIQINFPEVVGWAQKIAGLLTFHGIALFGGQRLVCYLKATDSGGHAKVALASPVAHPDPIPDA